MLSFSNLSLKYVICYVHASVKTERASHFNIPLHNHSRVSLLRRNAHPPGPLIPVEGRFQLLLLRRGNTSFPLYHPGNSGVSTLGKSDIAHILWAISYVLMGKVTLPK
jgi:hypothetical protein